MRFTQALAFQASRVSQLQTTRVQNLHVTAVKQDFPQRGIYNEFKPKRSPYKDEPDGHCFYVLPLLDPGILRWEHAKDITIDYYQYSREWIKPLLVLFAAGYLSYFWLRGQFEEVMIRKGIDPEILQSQHDYKYGKDKRFTHTLMSHRYSGKKVAQPRTMFSNMRRGRWGNDDGSYV